MATIRGYSCLFRTGLMACKREVHHIPCISSNSRSLSTRSPCLTVAALAQEKTRAHNSSIHNFTVCSKCYSSDTLASKPSPVGFTERLRSVLGMKTRARFPPYKMSLTGYNLLRSSADLIDFEEFFDEFDMPDTFNSWFLILELHVWLCMVRLSSEGSEGEYVRDNLIESMWKDVQERIKVLGGTSATTRRQSLDEMNGHFRASLLAYDEGLLSDDRVLGGALWRVFLEKRKADPRQLAQLVEYVRKQVKYLDEMNSEIMLCRGHITFLPLFEEIRKYSPNVR